MENSLIDIKSTREAEFKMLDIFDTQETHFCKLRISVVEMTYKSGLTYYDISYNYNFSDESQEAKRAHPFFYNKKILESNDVVGVIIIKNKMTETMVEYLLMESEKLGNEIGYSWWMQYKIRTMEAINLLWD